MEIKYNYLNLNLNQKRRNDNSFIIRKTISMIDNKLRHSVSQKYVVSIKESAIKYLIAVEINRETNSKLKKRIQF